MKEDLAVVRTTITQLSTDIKALWKKSSRPSWAVTVLLSLLSSSVVGLGVALLTR